MTVLTNVDPEYKNVEASQLCREIRQQKVTPLENISSVCKKMIAIKAFFLDIFTFVAPRDIRQHKWGLKRGLLERTFQHL